MTVKQLSRRQAGWALVLSAIDFEITHRAGKTNPADGPSRRPDYENTVPIANTLLPTLQNKLALSATCKSLTLATEERKYLENWSPALCCRVTNELPAMPKLLAVSRHEADVVLQEFDILTPETEGIT